MKYLSCVSIMNWKLIDDKLVLCHMEIGKVKVHMDSKRY